MGNMTNIDSLSLYDYTSIKNAICKLAGRTNVRRDATFCAKIFNFSPIALHRRYRVPLGFFPEISFSVSDKRPTLLFVKFELTVTNIFIRLTAKKKEKEECFQKNGRDTYEHFFYHCFTVALL